MSNLKYQGPQFITDDLLEVVFHSELDGLRRYYFNQSDMFGTISQAQLGVLHAPFATIVHGLQTQLLEASNFQDRQELIRKRLVLAVKADIGYERYDRFITQINQEIADFINFVLTFQSGAFDAHPAEKILDNLAAPLYKKISISKGVQIETPPKELVSLLATLTGSPFFSGSEGVELVSDNVFVSPLRVEKGRIVSTQIVPSRVARSLATRQMYPHWMIFDRFIARFFNVAFNEDLSGTTLAEVCAFTLDKELKKHFPKIYKTPENSSIRNLQPVDIELGGETVTFKLTSYWQSESEMEKDIDVCQVTLNLGDVYHGFRLKLSENGEYMTHMSRPEVAIILFTFPEVMSLMISTLRQLLNQPAE